MSEGTRKDELSSPVPSAPKAEAPTQVEQQQEDLHSPTALGILKTLVFIIVIQVFALYITRVNAPAVQASGYQYAPAGTSSGGSITNVLILLGGVVVATLGALWLARQRRVKIFMAAVFIGTSLALFLLTLLTSIDILSSYLDANATVYISLALATSTIVVLGLVTLRRIPSWFALLLTGTMSAEVGSYFASTIPIETALLLPLAFSLYDVYTVFRGPLRSLVNTLPAESLAAISSKVGDFSLGTGDTVFYAMIPALPFYRLLTSGITVDAVLPWAVATVVAVDVGVCVTLYLLTKSKLLPGLPIPMGLGLAVVLIELFLFGAL